MAGKKDKKEGKSSILPKSIAGIKLPKDVRRKLTGLAQHPVVADLIAAGLVALAARIKNEPEAKPADAAAKPEDKPEAQPLVSAPVDEVATPVVKRVRKPAAPAVAVATPAKAPRKAAAAPAKAEAAARPVAKRTSSRAPAKPRAPRAPKTEA